MLLLLSTLKIVMKDIEWLKVCIASISFFDLVSWFCSVLFHLKKQKLCPGKYLVLVDVPQQFFQYNVPGGPFLRKFFVYWSWPILQVVYCHQSVH